jgi:molybdopterin-guanine dinucleotide biosynthesis protein A
MIELCAGLILCGGDSRRMGRPKAWLPFGDEPLLSRVVRQLQGVVSPIVVVGAGDATLPPLPPGVEFVCDRQHDRGPLEGLCVGLATLAPHAPAAFVVGCDYPFVAPEFIERLARLSAGHEAAVVRVDGRLHPLAAIYRTSLVAKIDELLSSGRSALLDLVAASQARLVEPGEFADLPSPLASLQNVNTPEEYAAALAKAGFGAT